MSCQSRVDEWTTAIRTELSPLSRPQATGLALWSLGMGFARSGALTAVGTLLAPWLDRKAQTMRHPWHEFGAEAEAQRGLHRQALAVEPCLVPRLRWVLHLWHGPPLALALAATTRGTRFTVVAVSVG